MKTSNPVRRTRPTLRAALEETLATLSHGGSGSATARVGAVLAVVEEQGLLHQFPWQRWIFTPEGARFFSGSDAFASATPDDLCRVLTVHVEVERAEAGHLIAEIESGRLPALLERLHQLAAVSDDNGGDGAEAPVGVLTSPTNTDRPH